MGEEQEGKDVKRVKTGISGFDELLNGGIPEKRSILLSGPAGVGKTIFAMQFLVNGAREGEPGIYVTLEYTPQKMLGDMVSFNWELERLIEEGKLTIIDASRKRIGEDGSEYSMSDLLREIYDAVKTTNACRVVIDSVPALNFMPTSKVSMRSIIHEIYFGKLDEKKKREFSSINPLGEQLPHPDRMRLMIYLLNRLLSDMLEVTSLVITEIEKEDRYGEKFVFDGVIELERVLEGLRYHRTLRIPKMRGTKTTETIYEFTITDNGVVVFQLSI